MANIERSEGTPAGDKPLHPVEGLAIIATPTEGEQARVTHTPTGGFTIFLKGEIKIAYEPAVPKPPESIVPAAPEHRNSQTPADTASTHRGQHSESGTPSSESSPTPLGQLPESEAPESIVRPSEPPSNGLVYQTTLRSLSATNRAALLCPPVTHPVPTRPMPSKFRNRKTRSMSLSVILSEIRPTGCEDPANGLRNLS